MKLNSNGRLVKHSYSNLRRFNALLLIMKTTSIMIYDRELKYKRHIQHGSEGEIRHVSTISMATSMSLILAAVLF